MKQRIRSICKTNEYYDDSGIVGANPHKMVAAAQEAGLLEKKKYDHLVIGQLYEFTIDDNGYNLLVMDDSEIPVEKIGKGFIFFHEQPLYTQYDYYHFFMSKEEMRNINIDTIIDGI